MIAGKRSTHRLLLICVLHLVLYRRKFAGGCGGDLLVVTPNLAAGACSRRIETIRLVGSSRLFENVRRRIKNPVLADSKPKRNDAPNLARIGRGDALELGSIERELSWLKGGEAQIRQILNRSASAGYNRLSPVMTAPAKIQCFDRSTSRQSFRDCWLAHLPSHRKPTRTMQARSSHPWNWGPRCRRSAPLVSKIPR